MFSNNENDHLKSLEEIFKRCRQYNLKLRPTKCNFFQRKIEFLGHIMSGEGIEMNPKKVPKIVNAQAPTKPGELHSWVALVGYREFTQGFASETKVFQDLLLADKWLWEPVHQEAFEWLKSYFWKMLC